MAVEILGLADIGDGVLQRVAGQQDALVGQPDDCRVVAVDVELRSAAISRLPSVSRICAVEQPRRHDQRLDRRQAVMRACLDRRLAAREVRRVRRLAMISQSAKAAVPATWSRCQWLSTTVNLRTPRASSARADKLRVRHGDVRVVDQRLVALDQRIAGDAERQRAVVHPVGLGGEAVAFDAAVIERLDAVGGVRARADARSSLTASRSRDWLHNLRAALNRQRIRLKLMY